MDANMINELVEFFWGEYMVIAQREETIASYVGANFYDLPIDTINGVKLDTARIRLTPHEMVFWVSHKNGSNININKLAYMCETDILKPVWKNELIEGRYKRVLGRTRFTKLRIHEGVEQLADTISKLRFNIKKGAFTTLPIRKDPPAFKKLASLGTAVCRQETECCVCLEDTDTHFRQCNHHICGVCISHLKSMVCPMCRADYNEDEEEEEEED